MKQTQMEMWIGLTMTAEMVLEKTLECNDLGFNQAQISCGYAEPAANLRV
jgi:hypothetical protein